MLEQKRRTAEENKTIFEIRVNKWKIDLVYHKEVIIPEWEAQCAEVDGFFFFCCKSNYPACGLDHGRDSGAP